MQLITERRTDISISAIYAMRHSGATLQQIADRLGRTKERVRQILISNYGSTKHKLISTEQLCRILNLPRSRLLRLHQDGVIDAAREWNTTLGRYLLWSPTTVEQINLYYKTHRRCRMCHSYVPKGKRLYCSEQCYEESRKYKYKSIEAKQRHLKNIKAYRERRKMMLTTTASS